ncbi:Endonuclease/exonuclease/phosphatase [Zychaea mexicana]|uniref:Endonuclease/exonuclease/phosphatase n=1 Tax=Zychaea mexicana TaxID=64656 RepID=UPI0022FF400B|nr:Endonuclease/exonuclease/phosphatase [Zychaea mexicana]KAI9496507.1 Endonuclease/exonuclease/phosphatase [Zychaea mexicana]
MYTRTPLLYWSLTRLVRKPSQPHFLRLPTVAITTMPPKRKNSNAPVKPAKKKKTWEPFDPTLPRNVTLPEDMTFPKAPEGSIKLASFNVGGLNSSIKKGFKNYVAAENADIIFLQETKVNQPVSTAVDDKVYKYRYWAFDDKKGYSGVAVFSKYKPEKVERGLPDYDEGSRGRVITLYFPAFTLVACYVPNSGDKLKNLERRKVFNQHMEKFLRSLQKEGRAVIWAGDLNVAHTRKDIARPDTNTRSAGFTVEERADFDRVLATSTDGNDLPGLIDTWRHFHPETEGHYTYYSYRFQCRSKLIGWRLDYFVVTPDLMDKVVESEIRQIAYGASDHVPLVLVLKDVDMGNAANASSPEEDNDSNDTSETSDAT